MAVKIAPSIVSADLSRLADQVRHCEEAGAEYIHIDIMDGQFVPRITIGEPIVEAIRKGTGLVLDIHLMVADPEKQAPRYIEAGGDIINVHWEAATHIHRIVGDVRAQGRRVGVCINPGTHENVLDQLLPELDQVMVMAVNPGASGQAFIESVLPKVERLRSTIDANGYRAEIEIDGGVKAGNASRCAAAGADVLVAASAIFNEQASIGENIRGLRDAVAALA
ncbi:MAG TPA: ribulose-phosphate 3-epimerase [Dehalococcoidia bacterium]|nr:ribulose-phosphate 3-epimerase [Dehalococcoidia bacterium]